MLQKMEKDKTGYNAVKPIIELIDLVKVSCPVQHRIGHFRDVLPSQSRGLLPKKLNPTQQKQEHKI